MSAPPRSDGKQGSVAAKPPSGGTDYLDVMYSAQRRPPSDYPSRLAGLISQSLPGGARGRLLDLGCGRGDMMRAFAGIGFDVVGVDGSPRVATLCAPFETHVRDLERETLPLPSNQFDVVFTKSVIEHLRDPMPMLREAMRVLRPGGRMVVMTPSWRHHAFGPFYLDHTHVTPFTAPSLRDALRLSGFTGVTARHMRQLPFLWKMPFMAPLVWLVAAVPLPYAPLDDMRWQWPPEVNKLIRFSKEVMLLAIAEKPATGGGDDMKEVR